MWRPSLNFVTLHYAYILFTTLLGIVVLYPYGNVSAIDAFFFGSSASTESGLNPVDLKELKMYQQLYLYFVPMVTNMGFINMIVVVVRLFWFKKHLKDVAPNILRRTRRHANDGQGDPECGTKISSQEQTTTSKETREQADIPDKIEQPATRQPNITNEGLKEHPQGAGPGDVENPEDFQLQRRVTFDPATDSHPRKDTALYIPGPRDRDQGQPLVELKEGRVSRDDLSIRSLPGPSTNNLRRRHPQGPRFSEARSIEQIATAATSMFIIGTDSHNPRPSIAHRPASAAEDFPQLSRAVTVGRNSQFLNLTKRDREELGGIEYRSLKLLLKIVLIYFFGLHIFGVICLVGWIQHADPKYRDYLSECGISKNWWAFYSAQTMVDNLGFTLTPDSMVSFSDSTFVMLIMSFIAFAGHTCYPVFLRLVIWTTSKLAPKKSSIQEPLSFLLNHPRRCYTLLFPSASTWILFGILIALNFTDTLLIIVLDLDNESVARLPAGPRVAAAIFQSVSSRHTGTASFNLADVNPAVQFSLLVMMYISIFPIAMSIRTSNTYEERSLGIFKDDENGSYDEQKGARYLKTHLQNQLSFDLWYMFLGIFCICIAESSHIMDDKDPAFAVFPIFFEVVSA
ncbi:Fc.00g071670.m01.CDS01 [Cosmosporella sp. VM-42]